jgi:hypothetical protein
MNLPDKVTRLEEKGKYRRDPRVRRGEHFRRERG